MGHLGLTPQSIYKFGTYSVRAREKEEAAKLIEDAKLLEAAGCFAIVLEKIPADLATKVTAAVNIPTIGIGASPACDGQILVTQDMVGLFADFTPKFVKRYVDLGAALNDAAKAYADDVRNGRFPGLEHCFGVEKPES